MKIKKAFMREFPRRRFGLGAAVFILFVGKRRLAWKIVNSLINSCIYPFCVIYYECDTS